MGSNLLYVFIDESGNHSKGDYYAVAGSWCLSRRTDPAEVLSPTKDRLIAHLDQPHSELKGSKLSNEALNELVPAISSYGYEDTTVSHTTVPWTTQEPLRCTLHEVNPELATSVIADTTGAELQAPELLQTLALASVLNPIFNPDRIDRSAFTEIKVILDDTTWSRPMERIKQGIDLLTSERIPSDLQFNIRDSTKTPGVQVADLTAYSWARHLRKGDCGSAADAIHGLRFSEY